MSIRLKILLGCLAMLALTVGLGVYERQQAHGLGRLAIGVYEQSLMSISYARSAQAGFLRLDAAGAAAGKVSPGKLKDVLEDLDVAIERASSASARELGTQLRARLADLRDSAQAADAADKLAAIDEMFDNL